MDDDERVGRSEEIGWGTPIQRLHMLTDRCFAEGLNAEERATYDVLEADVARTCGTTSAAVARLLLQRELARRAEARSPTAHRSSGVCGVLVPWPQTGDDHRLVHPFRDLTFLQPPED